MIQNDHVVSMNYVLTDKKGAVLDESHGDPLEYLHGHQNIIPGLEKALTGMKVGEKKRVEVPAAEAYGDYDADKCFPVERSAFGGKLPKEGMMVEMRGGDHHMVARVTKVTDQEVHLDANHQLAGQDLTFEVEIAAVRPATAEELAHGHVHGPHGHHHH